MKPTSCPAPTPGAPSTGRCPAAGRRPGIEDAQRAMNAAQSHVDAAVAADDEAVRGNHCRQAGQRLTYAGSVLKGLAPETTDPGRWGADMVLPGRAPRYAPVGGI